MKSPSRCTPDSFVAVSFYRYAHHLTASLSIAVAVDSSGASKPAVMGSPAHRVSLRDDGEEASGESRNSAGGVLLKDSRSRSGDAGGGSRAEAEVDAARASAVSSDPTQQGESGRELEVLVRPPRPEGMSARFDAREA